MSTKVEELLSGIEKCDMSKPFAFVSYSKKDSEKVYQVVRELQKNGYNIWVDKELKQSVGIDWQQDALKAIAKPACKVILYFVSENSLVSAPVCAELCWSKSNKVKANNQGEEMKIIPINVSENWDYQMPFSTWVLKVAENAGAEELENDDFDVLREIIDDKYISGKEAFDNHGEIAMYIKNNIFEPLGGNKITFANYNDITTIMDNMKMTRVKDGDDVTVTAMQKEEEIAEVEVADVGTQEEAVNNADIQTENVDKIGVYVQNTMQNLIEKDLLSEDLIAKMLDAKWSKEVLHLSYAMLIKINPEKDIKEQVVDGKGRSRYWTKIYNIAGENYCVCNDWYEKHRKYFEEFLTQLEAGATFEVSSEKKKVFSLTGDVTYTLYGKQYSENQSDMMLRVFAQVLNRHQDKVDSLPEQDGMNCAEKYENIEQPGTSAAKPSYFRVCSNFEFDNGSAVCIGTAYSSGDKMKKIAKLLEICGEDRSVFYSEQLELPELERNKVSSKTIEYTLYGQKYSGDQTEMMTHVCSTVIAKHPEKLQELVDNTLCIGYNNSSAEEKTYFRVSRLYQCGGREYKVGTSFGMAEKLKQIAKVFAICGEDSDILQVEGYEFAIKEVKDKKVKVGKEKKNFFE